MIYRSNLKCPDLQPLFEPLICKPRHWSLGHDVLSDPELDPDCCFMTHDEAAILYHCAKAYPGIWADIGCRKGWSSAHIWKAGCGVDCVDPLLEHDCMAGRFGSIYPMKSFEYFRHEGDLMVGACIDGDHDSPAPTADACMAVMAGARVLFFHDFWGKPIREAVHYLSWNGFKFRTYDTPNGCAVCWTDPNFQPPDHVPDPAINWSAIRQQKAAEFDFSRAS